MQTLQWHGVSVFKVPSGSISQNENPCENSYKAVYWHVNVPQNGYPRNSHVVSYS